MEFDSTDSPFIRLPSPHQNIILAPPSMDDEAAILAAMNDPSVYMNLIGPPFPFTRQDFVARQVERIAKCDRALEAFLLMEKSRREGGAGGRWVGDVPLGAIRRVDEVTGEKEFVGEFSLRRRRFSMREEGEKLKAFNDGLEVGDERIGWDIGFYLAPKFQGKGIMAVVLKTLRDGYMVPYMNVWDFQGSFLEHNQASRRVFEKCGFVFEKLLKDVIELNEAKTGVKGKMTGMGFVKWRREDMEGTKEKEAGWQIPRGTHYSY